MLLRRGRWVENVAVMSVIGPISAKSIQANASPRATARMPSRCSSLMFRNERPQLAAGLADSLFFGFSYFRSPAPKRSRRSRVPLWRKQRSSKIIRLSKLIPRARQLLLERETRPVLKHPQRNICLRSGTNPTSLEIFRFRNVKRIIKPFILPIEASSLYRTMQRYRVAEEF
jgi:hypothetical protein